jgi:KDO2-lipid IV(A) lauroyltransferase
VAGVELLFPKGGKGARAAMLHLAHGGRLGILVDQKMNEGIETTLFGQPVMATTSAAAFALRFRCPMVPGHTIRLGPARFRIVVEPPLPLPDSGDHHADIRAVTQAMNDCLERWIREWPEGWLWLHRRFPLEIYKR